jgi:hypothetical protein
MKIKPAYLISDNRVTKTFSINHQFIYAGDFILLEPQFYNRCSSWGWFGSGEMRVKYIGELVMCIHHKIAMAGAVYAQYVFADDGIAGIFFPGA